MKVMQEMKGAGTEVTLWKDSLERKAINFLTIEDRMGEVLFGIELGVEPATAMAACGVLEHEYGTWLESPANRDRFNRANALADAQLEHLLYQASLIDPMLAGAVLERRQRNREKLSKGGNSSKKMLGDILGSEKGIYDGVIKD